MGRQRFFLRNSYVKKSSYFFTHSSQSRRLVKDCSLCESFAALESVGCY